MFRQTAHMVHSTAVCYNVFMNGVDLFLQCRSTNATEGKEIRLQMITITFLLDEANQCASPVLHNRAYNSLKLPCRLEFKG